MQSQVDINKYFVSVVISCSYYCHCRVIEWPRVEPTKLTPDRSSLCLAGFRPSGSPSPSVTTPCPSDTSFLIRETRDDVALTIPGLTKLLFFQKPSCYEMQLEGSRVSSLLIVLSMNVSFSAYLNITYLGFIPDVLFVLGYTGSTNPAHPSSSVDTFLYRLTDYNLQSLTDFLS